MTDASAFPTFQIQASKTPMPVADREAAFGNLGFGTLFSDHMAVIRYNEAKGWYGHSIEARAPFMIDPAAAVLHYGQEIFEGMKAYRSNDGSISLFRPKENARRFNLSAQRMAMPELPEDHFIAAIEHLARQDAAWIPDGEGASLYLRPYMFASEPFLGVRPSREYIFCVIASPVGPYFKGGGKPISVWVSENYTRAAAGGTGAAKCGGNYAASLVAQAEAYRNGCDQVVFLDATERSWIEELGGMNIFFVFDDGSLVTPPLGTILPGITRASLITMMLEQGMSVTESLYSFSDWKRDAQSGRLRETFACGTAAVVASIGFVKFNKGEFPIGNGEEGPITVLLRQQLTGLQRGLVDDPHGWVHKLK